MTPFLQYWPILVAVAAGLVGFRLLIFWIGRPSLSGTIAFVMADIALGAVLFHYAGDAGMTDLFAGEYNEKSLASFTALCDRGCQAPPEAPGLCRSYCRCLTAVGQNRLAYDEMLAHVLMIADERVEEAWAGVDRNCRSQLNLR